jgi:cell fate regulator YaaT (PSP1 superfamily)
MPGVVGVRFRKCGKIYKFEVNGIDAKPGTQVVVESEMGLSIGEVVFELGDARETEEQLKKVIRIATEEDLETRRNNQSLGEEAKSFCIEKVKSRNLPMKIVGTEATLDRKRLIFYFTADGRIDFRELVRDLAAKFRTRIEMRQIGVRDEVKHLGAMGICGREVCCRTFLTTFEPISIRMAKKQELVLNPGKLSGICGRLMCCLGYEIEQEEKKGEEEIIVEEAAEETVVITDETVVNDQTEKETQTETINQPSEDVPEVKKDLEIPTQPETPKHKHHKHKERHHRDKQKQREKGKPFSRRKKFFKKKKRHNK